MFATEKEIEEARTRLISVIGYDSNYTLGYIIRRVVMNDGKIYYNKYWESSCFIHDTECKCCNKREAEFFVTINSSHKTPMDAVEDLIVKVKSGNNV